MFTLGQIKETHARVKSGADFPKYIQEINSLGVIQYTFLVTDGNTVFTGSNNFIITSEPIYPQLEIAESGDKEKFKSYLKIHQQGQTDFISFCRHCAETGVEKWIVDTAERTCSYFDLTGIQILTEIIP